MGWRVSFKREKQVDKYGNFILTPHVLRVGSWKFRMPGYYEYFHPAIGRIDSLWVW